MSETEKEGQCYTIYHENINSALIVLDLLMPIDIC